VIVQIWTMRISDTAEAVPESWCAILEAAERQRALRFMFNRHRVTYVAAHVLTRVVFSMILPDVAAASWRFLAGTSGKPVAFVGEQAAPISFNLSHADGIVGLAVIGEPDHAVGFDLEALDRRVTLDVADRYFCPEEVAWLFALPRPEQATGFLRLWTLKEAFIKATGEGLSRDLASFWFAMSPPRIHFTSSSRDQSDDWRFEQRQFAGHFVAAVGVHAPHRVPVTFEWNEVDPTSVSAAIR
jgi:4'-phosphopantetheinyl transferase